MKWLMLVVALVLGAGITWLLTVKTVTRTVLPGQPTPPDGGEAAPDEAPRHERADEGAFEDEAAAFGGSETREVSSRTGWDRTAQDEDALFPHQLSDDGGPRRDGDESTPAPE